MTYLQHTGLKGQKWGTRRFRNYDGKLTEAGQIRYKTWSTNENSLATSRTGASFAYNEDEDEVYVNDGSGRMVPLPDDYPDRDKIKEKARRMSESIKKVEENMRHSVYLGGGIYGVVSTDELMHYGVPGMKWGVRRYQDYNGNLTAAGRKQLASDKKGFKSRMKIRGQGIKQDISDTIRSVKAAKGTRNKLGELVGHGRTETHRLNRAWTEKRLANASKTKTFQYIHNVDSKNFSGLARTSQKVKNSSAGRRMVNYLLPMDDFNTPYQRLSGRKSRYGITYLAQLNNMGIMSAVLDVGYIAKNGDPRKKKV